MRHLDAVHGQRRETPVGAQMVIQEPGRTIIRDGRLMAIRRDEAAGRFGHNASNVRSERRGMNTATIIDRGNGTRVVNVTVNGQLVRRSRWDRAARLS
jgi:hypothetical protein